MSVNGVKGVKRMIIGEKHQIVVNRVLIKVFEIVILVLMNRIEEDLKKEVEVSERRNCRRVVFTVS